LSPVIASKRGGDLERVKKAGLIEISFFVVGLSPICNQSNVDKTRFK